MWISDGDDEAADQAAEPAPAGWSDDPAEMKRRARAKFVAGDFAGAKDILEALYEQGLRHPVALNVATCYQRLGDLPNAAAWMAAGLDDPAYPQPEPVAYDASTGRAGHLEAFYQWSRGQQYP